jgi:uncharacterized protein (UPF0332 family)/predicted nucleotidyltransferase
MKTEAEILSRIKQTVLERESTANIYLYGSRARGDAKPDSDWDLLILLNKEKITDELENNIADQLYDLEFDSPKESPHRFFPRKNGTLSTYCPLSTITLRKKEGGYDEFEQFSKYRARRVEEAIEETDIMIAHKHWNAALSRLYYVCFYAVGSLLIKNGIKTTRQPFGMLFIKTGKLDRELGKHYNRLFEKRKKGDYGHFFVAEKKTVSDFYEPSKCSLKK